MKIARLSPLEHAPEAIRAFRSVEAYIAGSGLPHSLVELVKMRASQLNGCAFCLDMHSKDARRHGETEQRLYVLAGWRDSPLYTPAERAALAWTEALTRLTQQHPSEAEYQELRAHFADKDIVDLTALIGMINLWNRLAIGMHYVHDVEAGQDAA
jgi:AhpD family alkylhydroperoxidase